MFRRFVFIFSLMLFVNPVAWAQEEAPSSPLSIFSDEWNDPLYEVCNTAAGVQYMSEEEKEVIYILNLARSDPKRFAETVVKQYPAFDNNEYLRNSNYLASLVKRLERMKPLNLLLPDPSCFASAECHATSMGLSGRTGHTRMGKCAKKTYYNGECCDYGNAEPVDIVLRLLIDYQVPSLGHRNICLGNYRFIGVAIRPHKKWSINAVLDLHY